jgi:hypothetical protein
MTCDYNRFCKEPSEAPRIFYDGKAGSFPHPTGVLPIDRIIEQYMRKNFAGRSGGNRSEVSWNNHAGMGHNGHGHGVAQMPMQQRPPPQPVINYPQAQRPFPLPVNNAFQPHTNGQHQTPAQNSGMAYPDSYREYN